jgi:hypothetical protein
MGNSTLLGSSIGPEARSFENVGDVPESEFVIVLTRQNEHLTRSTPKSANVALEGLTVARRLLRFLIQPVLRIGQEGHSDFEKLSFFALSGLKFLTV